MTNETNTNETNTNEMIVNARVDRALTWYRGGSYRYMVVDIEAPDIESERNESRKPLNLALVIDRSGSMAGHPLDAAKEAAIGVANGLTEDDTLSVVCFDDETSVILNSVRMDAVGRDLAEHEIDRIRSGGTTDLSSGWLEGAELVAEVMNADSSFRNQVVVLSDGHANRGETNPSVLAEYASGLQARGIITSTVGIGDGYSPEVLQAIAENGGGRMHDAEYPHEIIEVVMAELNEITGTYSDQLNLEIYVPDDVELKCLSNYPAQEKGNGYINYQLGSINKRAVKQVVFQIKSPRGEIDELMDFRVSVNWLHDEVPEAIMTHVLLTQVSGRANDAQPRDIETSLVVARTWQARIMRSITDANIHHDIQRLRDIEKNEFRYFKRYCHGLPGGEEMIRPLGRLLRRARRPMVERSRKEVTLAAYHMQKGESDKRFKLRDDWTSFIE